MNRNSVKHENAQNTSLRIITWNEAPLYDLFVRPPSLMNFGGTWLSCKEKNMKISFALFEIQHHF